MNQCTESGTAKIKFKWFSQLRIVQYLLDQAGWFYLYESLDKIMDIFIILFFSIETSL